MKKLLVFPIIFILTLSVVLAAGVTRNMPYGAEPGSTIQVTLALSGVTQGSAVKMEDTIPSSFKLESWDVSDSMETKVNLNYGKLSKKEGFDTHSWAFTSKKAPTVTYNLIVPTTPGTYEFDVSWLSLDGSGNEASTLNVAVGAGSQSAPPQTTPTEANPPAEEAKPTETSSTSSAPATPQPTKPSGKVPVTAIVIVAAIILIILFMAMNSKKQKKQDSNQQDTKIVKKTKKK